MEGHQKGRSEEVAGGEPGCTVYDSVQDCRDRITVERRVASIERRPMRHYRQPIPLYVDIATKLFELFRTWNSLKKVIRPESPERRVALPTE